MTTPSIFPPNTDGIVNTADENFFMTSTGSDQLVSTIDGDSNLLREISDRFNLPMKYIGNVFRPNFVAILRRCSTSVISAEVVCVCKFPLMILYFTDAKLRRNIAPNDSYVRVSVSLF